VCVCVLTADTCKLDASRQMVNSMLHMLQHNLLTPYLRSQNAQLVCGLHMQFTCVIFRPSCMKSCRSSSSAVNRSGSNSSNSGSDNIVTAAAAAAQQ